MIQNANFLSLMTISHIIDTCKLQNPKPDTVCGASSGQSAAGLEVEHDDSKQPLTPEEQARKAQAYQKQCDEIKAMKAQGQQWTPGDGEEIKDYGFSDQTKDPEADKVDLSGTKGLAEVRNLPDISQMTDEQVKQELQSYGIQHDGVSDSKLRGFLSDARNSRAEHDIGSDKVDGHIGTYVQGRNLYCTVLSNLDSMSDEQIRNLYQVEIDSNGQKQYRVTFPMDIGSEDKSVVITQQELDSHTITVTGDDGEPRTLSAFPTGDADVTMITMAFVKRFGPGITDGGAWSFQTQNVFRRPEQSKLLDNQHLEDIEDYSSLPKDSMFAILEMGEVARKTDSSGKPYTITPLFNEDLSWLPKQERITALASEGIITTLSDGRKACICSKGIYLSDGTVISGGHAMAYRGYDEQTGEIIISGSEFNNQSEVRVPKDLMPFFCTASTEGTAGVAQTPQPGAEEITKFRL